MQKNYIKAFTLIELLVVIAIISMLMSITAPSLRKAKDKAKTVVCQSNLRQWGASFLMYTDDNDGFFADPTVDKMIWTRTMEQYYQVEDMRLCPKAVKPAYPQGLLKPIGSTILAWGKFDGTNDTIEGMYGSYGINGWVYNPSTATWKGHDTSNNWRKADVANPSTVPLFLDCTWMAGCPEPEDGPPAQDGESSVDLGGESMARFCINRHDKYINGVFLDWGIRKIGLKELWKLKWHKKFDTNGPWTKEFDPQWPEWMLTFKDY